MTEGSSLGRERDPRQVRVEGRGLGGERVNNWTPTSGTNTGAVASSP